MKTILIFLILNISRISLAEIGSVCDTPNGDKGECKPLRTCDVIVQELKTGNPDVINFIQDSHCGYDEEALVCCGSFGNNKPIIAAVGLQNTSVTELPHTSVCGKHYITRPKMIEGSTTKLREFPWLAVLHYTFRETNEPAGVRCGGSLINKRFVLTACHCLETPDIYLSSVVLGEWDTDTEEDCFGIEGVAGQDCIPSTQEFEIEKILPHPYYASYGQNNDIALLKLNRDVKFDVHIQPICLSHLPENILPGALMTVSGWGSLSGNPSSVSPIKLKAYLPLYNHTACLTKHSNMNYTSSQICAGGTKGEDPCYGDGGGPLMISYINRNTFQEKWYLVGIVMNAKGCADGAPSVFTRVSKYYKWILKNIAKP